MTGNGGADSGVEAVIPNAGASGSGWGGNGARSEDFGLSLNFGTSPSPNAAEPTPAENDGAEAGAPLRNLPSVPGRRAEDSPVRQPEPLAGGV
jgi:hypothetical protein